MKVCVLEGGRRQRGSCSCHDDEVSAWFSHRFHDDNFSIFASHLFLWYGTSRRVKFVEGSCIALASRDEDRNVIFLSEGDVML